MNLSFLPLGRASVLFGLLGCLPLSGATFLLLDFDDEGPNPLGFWNTLGNPNSGQANLVESNGGATSISVAASGWTIGLGYDLNNWTSGDVDWLSDTAADDGWSVEDAVATITFSGLNNLSQYRMEVVSTSRFGGDVADYMVGGAFAPQTYTGATDSLGNDWDAKVHGNDAGNWLIWDNLNPDAGGNLTLTVDGSGSFGDVSAIRLVQIPEPATTGLLGLALLTVIRRKRA